MIWLWPDFLSKFKRLHKKLPPKDVKFGAEYLTYCLNAPVYLKWIRSQVLDLAQQLGVSLELERKELNSLKEVSGFYPNCSAIFNASGKGLKYDGRNDSECLAVRGQIMLLEVLNQKSIRYFRRTLIY